MTVVFEDGSTAHLEPMALAAYSRTTLEMGTIFPSVRGKRPPIVRAWAERRRSSSSG